MWIYTVPKTRLTSEKIRENFPVIRGNDDYFPRITGKFSTVQGTSSSLPTKICHIFGTMYFLVQWLTADTYVCNWESTQASSDLQREQLLRSAEQLFEFVGKRENGCGVRLIMQRIQEFFEERQYVVFLGKPYTHIIIAR